jgi:hypothetical protein
MDNMDDMDDMGSASLRWHAATKSLRHIMSFLWRTRA